MYIFAYNNIKDPPPLPQSPRIKFGPFILFSIKVRMECISAMWMETISFTVKKDAYSQFVFNFSNFFYFDFIILKKEVEGKRLLSSEI